MNWILLVIFLSFNALTAEVNYDLLIKHTDVKVGNSSYRKLTVNGSLPAPTLYFTEGDMAQINVRNMTDEIVTLHWHGILLPNEFDGVPWVTQLPIKPGEAKLYRFPIKQKGTYWYHSHVMFQEQDGLFGAFVIYPKNKRDIQHDAEETIVLSDFSVEEGKTIHKNLKKGGDYYQIKKNQVQSWQWAFETGTAGSKFYNSLQRMEGMDYADVAYDDFLANGTPKLYLLNDDKKIKRVKLRIINGSASSIFKLTYGNGPIKIIGNDGTDIEPMDVSILPIGTAETYDIILELSANEMTELKATSLDDSGKAHIYFGNGPLKSAPQMPWIPPMGMTMAEMMGMPKMGFWQGFAMSYRNEFSDIPREIKRKESKYSLPQEMKMMKQKMHEHHMQPEVTGELEYSQIKAIEPFYLKEGEKLLTYHFTLNGNMENYVWSINGSPVGPESYILIKKGYRIRFVMKNTTMMNHPMHLHGHFFRVMTEKGYFSPKKHTVLVKPLSTSIIEFEASEDQDWFFHCHLLYHMMDGMTRIVRYEDHPAPQYLTDARKKSKEFNYTRDFFLSNKILAQSSYSRMEGKYFNSWYMAKYDVEANYDGNSESEIHFARTFTRFLTTYVGARMESDEFHYQGTPTVGVTWILPLNIGLDLKYQFNQNLDEFELEFENMIQLTSRAQLNLRYSSLRDWFSEIEYRHNKHFSTVISYHRLYENYGIGIGYTY